MWTTNYAKNQSKGLLIGKTSGMLSAVHSHPLKTVFSTCNVVFLQHKEIFLGYFIKLPESDLWVLGPVLPSSMFWCLFDLFAPHSIHSYVQQQCSICFFCLAAYDIHDLRLILLEDIPWCLATNLICNCLPNQLCIANVHVQWQSILTTAVNWHLSIQSFRQSWWQF